MAKQMQPIEQPFGNHSILDNIIHGIFGHTSDELTPEKAREKKGHDEANRDKAYGLARNAATNPGEQFMGPPASAGNGSILDLIGGIAKMFGGPGL